MENATFERFYIVSARIGLDGRQTMCNSFADDWDHAYGSYTFLSGMLADDNRVMAYVILMFADDGESYELEEKEFRARHLVDTRPLMDWIDQQEKVITVKPRTIHFILEN